MYIFCVLVSFQFSIEGADVDEQFDSLSTLLKHLMELSKADETTTTEACDTNTTRATDSSTAATTASNTISSGRAQLTRLLPPSDYDQPELLLLCAAKEKFNKSQPEKGPHVYRIDSLFLVSQDEKSILNGSFYRVIRARTAPDNTGREVAVKRPNLPSQTHTSRFLKMCDDWFKLSDCDAVVMALGVTLAPVTIVMEWFSLGPLDSYLTAHKSELQQVDLLEAVTHMAKALYFLSMEGIQHNNIRCHSLLVARHEESQFLVKLSEPGEPTLDSRSIHWIPREHHAHPPTAKYDPSTDVWAFATTAWQVFSEGTWPLHKEDLQVCGLFVGKIFRCVKCVASAWGLWLKNGVLSLQ